MKISYVIPFTSLTGGLKITFEFANHLHECGHQVNIIYPVFPYRLGERIWNFKATYWQLHGLLSNLIKKDAISWFDLKASINGVPWIADRFLPEADVVIATAWRWCNKFSESLNTSFLF